MLSTTQNLATYVGDGATTQFTYSFPIPDMLSQVVAITNNNVSPATVTILPSTQFSVTGIGNGIAGAQITTPGVSDELRSRQVRRCDGPNASMTPRSWTTSL